MQLTRAIIIFLAAILLAPGGAEAKCNPKLDPNCLDDPTIFKKGSAATGKVVPGFGKTISN